MIELVTPKKTKINLSDYQFQQDVQSRVLLSESSVLDVQVLEAILFSSLKTSVKKLALSLSCSEEELEPILQRLSSIGLIEYQNGVLLVDKERRKYFEFQMSRFEEDFKPNIDFVQGLLKQVPIHILPLWYAIPRTSNNIFESIVEKNLLTPQIYERYLEDLHFQDPIFHSIIQDLFASPSLEIPAQIVIAKYGLSQELFEEILIQLEFRFICFVTYRKKEGLWEEWVVPFYEWQRHLFFLKYTAAPAIEKKEIAIQKEEPFSFVKDMELTLNLIKEKKLTSNPKQLAFYYQLQSEELVIDYFKKILKKLSIMKLTEFKEDTYHPSEASKDWLSLSLESRALTLYRSSVNLHALSDSPLCSERNVREAEKIVKRVLHGEWVFFDDVLQGSQIWLNEESVKKPIKQWKPPLYTEEEKTFLKAVVFDWLFEAGMVVTGTTLNRDCFAITSFGQTFFGD